MADWQTGWVAGNALALAMALLIDAWLGEPRWLYRHVPHPVVLMGRLIGALDKRLNGDDDPSARRKRSGVVALCLLLVAVGVLVAGLWSLAAALHPLAGFTVSVLIGAMLLAQRSLADHVDAVRDRLAAGDLEGARQALAMIVGRDTAVLDESGIARAALESLAENHSDGVVAPAFWMLIAGPVGIALYKAVNTADSMIGHKTERHLAFGWAAAKLDDAANWLPARLSVILIALGALLARTRLSSLRLPSLRTIRRDAPTHASPNAGWPEASYASVLGLALGGPRRYPGYEVDAPFINADGRKALTAADIKAGLVLFQTSCVATTALIMLIALAGL